MTVLEMMTALEACGDASVWEVSDGGATCYEVTLQDFEGFDDEWCEVMRDYEDEELVDAFLDALESQALRCEGDFYHTYYFDGFCVQLGYASYDIQQAWQNLTTTPNAGVVFHRCASGRYTSEAQRIFNISQLRQFVKRKNATTQKIFFSQNT